MSKTLSLKAKVSTQSNKNSGCRNELLSLGRNEGSQNTQMEKWTHPVPSEVSSQWGISRKGSFGNTQKTCLFLSPASPSVVPIDQTVGWWGGGWLCTASLLLFWKQSWENVLIVFNTQVFCSLESNLRAEDWRGKGWCLGDVLWHWKKG